MQPCRTCAESWPWWRALDNSRRSGRGGIIAHAREQHGVLLIMLDGATLVLLAKITAMKGEWRPRLALLRYSRS